MLFTKEVFIIAIFAMVLSILLVEIVNFFQLHFYRNWINKLLEERTGIIIKAKKELEPVPPLTDEQEAEIEADRERRNKYG